MPLSAAAPRKAQHIRRYEAIGYLREDGLYDIEGHLTDEKTYPFDNRWRGTVVPGEKLHDMHLRLTINDDMEIVAVEAATEASPFSLCSDITASYQQLVGLRIVSGFSRKALERIGGVKGCTHISELLRVLGRGRLSDPLAGHPCKTESRARRQSRVAHCPTELLPRLCSELAGCGDLFPGTLPAR